MRTKIFFFLFFISIVSFTNVFSQTEVKPPRLPEYYAVIRGEHDGPFDLGQLQNMVYMGQINAQTLVWQEGMDSWTIAGQIEELKFIFLQTMTEKEIKFCKQVLAVRNINPSDSEEMQRLFNGFLAMGLVGAIMGDLFWTTGTILVSILCSRMQTVTYGDNYERGTIEYWKNTVEYYDDYSAMIGLATGIPFIVAGFIITPILCAVGFGNMAKTLSVYRKASGRMTFMSFLEKSLISGGYNWENKEVTVAMAIKL